MLIERAFIYSMLKDKHIITKTTLLSKHFSDELSKLLFMSIRKIYNHKVESGGDSKTHTSFISKNFLKKLVEKKPSILEDFEFEDVTNLETAIFSSSTEDTLDWLYFEDEIKRKYKDRQYQLILHTMHENIENGTWNIADAENFKNIEYSKIDAEVHGAVVMKGSNYIPHYRQVTKELNEAKNRGHARWYSLPMSKMIEDYTEVERGEVIDIVSETGGGKTILSCFLTIETAKKYTNERFLYVTGENSLEKIMDYLHASYFGISYKHIKKRAIDLDAYIDKLEESEHKDYVQVFSRITVLPIPSIPMNDLRRTISIAREKEQPFDIVTVDAFDNINERDKGDPLQRSERNAVEIELLAKDENVVMINLCQLKTQLYQTSIENIPKTCTHQSSEKAKKSALMIVVHYIIGKSKDGKESIRKSRQMRILKSRSGGENYRCKIEPQWERVKLISGQTVKPSGMETISNEEDLEVV